MNGVKDGLRAQRLLLADEDEQTYLDEAEGWLTSLAPNNPAEIDLVLDVVDIRWRLRRVDRAERSHLERTISKIFTASDEHKHARRVEDMVTAFTALARTVEHVVVKDGDNVEDMIGALGEIIDQMEFVERFEKRLIDGGVEFETAVGKLKEEAVRDAVLAATFDAMAATVPTVLNGVRALLTSSAATADARREQITKEVACGGGKEAQRLQRARQTLNRQFREALDMLSMLKQHRPPSGSFLRPVQVELRRMAIAD